MYWKPICLEKFLKRYLTNPHPLLTIFTTISTLAISVCTMTLEFYAMMAGSYAM